MGGNKFISSEPKSGLSAEEMQDLGVKIEAALNRANELNSDSLEAKAAMALKNKFISPEQDKELFELVNSSETFFTRYSKGERSQDLLECLEKHCQVLEQKRNEIFPDAPKDARLKLVREGNSGLDGKKEKVSGKKQPLKIKSKEGVDLEARQEGPDKEKEVELKINEDSIIRRAAEIKQKRINNQKGFEWAKIDALLHQKGVKPGTPAAEEFMAKWDKNTAESELRKEASNKERESVEGAPGKKASLKIKSAGESEKIVDETISARDISLEEIDTEERKEMEEYDKERELARLGADITLSKITDYKELWAENKKTGDEVFKKKTRELWKEFAVHGKVLRDKDSGELKVMKFTDLDGNSSLGLLALAGIDTKNLEHKEPGKYTGGRINIDTGERHGVIVEDGGQTVFIDHHSDESGKDNSATKFTYDLLVSLGLLEKQEYLDKLVEFVTQEDNKTYPNEERYFENYGRNLFGLRDHIKFEHLLEFFKEGHKPYEVLQEKELKKMGLFQVSKKKKEMVKESLAELARIKDKGLIIEAPRYGKIAVDVDKKIAFGFDAIRHAGYQTYLSWSPVDNSFFISSVSPITDSFAQGKNIRKTMWIKSPIDAAPLTLTLKDILLTMTDGKFEPTGELAEFLAKEEKGKKEKEAEKEVGKILSRGKMEVFIETGREFYEALKNGASWEGYDEQGRRTTLEIQTKVFLRKQLKKFNLVGDDKITDLVESLVKEIGK